MALQLPSTNPFAANMGVSLPAMYARVGKVVITPGQPAQASVDIYADAAARQAGKVLSGTTVAFSHVASVADPVAQAYAALKVRDEFANSKDV
jgi:ethanolamine utilization microcompartment shell protein EutS